MFAGQLASRHVGKRRQQRRLIEAITLLDLLEDIVGADDGVLNVRAAFSFEAERLVEVEGDDLPARELDQEIAHGGDRNLLRGAVGVGHRELGVPLRDLAAGLANRGIQQIVSLDAEAFAA